VGAHRLGLLVILDVGRSIVVQVGDLGDLDLELSGDHLATLLIDQVLDVAGLEDAAGDAIAECLGVVVAGLAGAALRCAECGCTGAMSIEFGTRS
jgi:hypothetical protein